jgi:prevent-host-death family protein
VVTRAVEADRPVLLTGRGRGVAVIQSMSDYEQAAEERAFMRAVVAGLADLDAGREVSLSEAGFNAG